MKLLGLIFLLPIVMIVTGLYLIPVYIGLNENNWIPAIAMYMGTFLMGTFVIGTIILENEK